MSQTCPDIAELEQFSSDVLDAQTSSAIVEHLNQCPDCAALVADLAENLKLAEAIRRGGSGNAAEEPCPTMIGPYRILRKIGQGGMGTVYEAEQDNPRRVVALKVVRPGLMSASLLARFRQESQVLGRLRHAGIAQVYEAGTHQAGHGPQPYFVMERVAGPPLLKHAQDHGLNTHQRLELLSLICDAVHHAHQHGVIHRDLKPDNILVDDTAQPPQPKILDFGVARVIDPSIQQTTLHTSAGQIVGTVAYMSPEQATGDVVEIDIRSDVYALGVIAFQLLSGRLPHKVSVASIADSVRAIVHDEPTTLASIDRSMRGDITTIVGKALAKEKVRRYQSAAEMGADLRRHLKNEPIAAHPPSTIYQLSKFARRNKGLVGGVIATFVVLTGGIIGTSVGLLQATQQRNAAEAARAAADASALAATTSADEAKKEVLRQSAVTRFLRDMLAAASPGNLSSLEVKGRDVTVLQALNAAADKVDAGSLKDQPETEIAVRDMIGATLEELGEYNRAADQIEKSMEIATRTFGEQSKPVANCLNSLGVLYGRLGRPAEAAESARRAVAIYSTLPEAGEQDFATLKNNLATILSDQGADGEAEVLWREVLEIRQREYGKESFDYAGVASNLAGLLAETGRPQEAEQMYRQSLSVFQKLSPEGHPAYAKVLTNLGTLLNTMNRASEGEPLMRQALEMQRRLLGDEHPMVVVILNNLARMEQGRKNFDGAEKLYREAIALQRKQTGDESVVLASLLNNLGTFYQAQGKIVEAESLMREALEMRHRLLGESHLDYANSLHNLAYLLDEQSKFGEAEAMYRSAIQIKLAAQGSAHPDTATSRV
ncbi:MAG TPA: serine/threonine-protein kinase, partial [Tepidisphaeraceae bacterium]|nr:serine/threonine-protein kinase [Tepidisphaeraceae bacterium]